METGAGNWRGCPESGTEVGGTWTRHFEQGQLVSGHLHHLMAFQDLLLGSSVSPGLWHPISLLTVCLRDWVNPINLLGNQWAQVLKEL